MDCNKYNLEISDSYVFFPTRSAAVSLLFITVFLIPFWILIIVLNTVPIIIKILFVIGACFFLSVTFIALIYSFKKIIVNASGIKVINTFTNVFYYQPWNSIEVIYRIYTPKGSQTLFFAVAPLTGDELKDKITRGGIKKGKLILSVDGNIWFRNTANAKKLNRFLPSTLKIQDVYVNWCNKFIIK